MNWKDTSFHGKSVHYTCESRFAYIHIGRYSSTTDIHDGDWYITILEIRDNPWFIHKSKSLEEVKRFAVDLYREALTAELGNIS